MRVTLISLEWPGDDHVGGVGRYAYRLAEAIKNDVDLTVVTRDGARELAGVEIVSVKRASSRYGRYYLEPLRVRGLVKRSRPDVVHSFGDGWAVPHRWPTVRTFMGSSLEEARSSTGLRKANHYVLALTEHYSKRTSDLCVAIGPDSLDEFNCHELMPPLTPVANSLAAKSPDPAAVFIGSFHGRKRGELAQRIVQKASATLNRHVELTVVGPEADRSLWHPNVRFLSGLSDVEVSDAVRRSWVLLAPSLYEGFGIPVFEAMSQGTAAVVSDNPGTRFLRALSPGSTSIAVARDDSDLVSLVTEAITKGPNFSNAQHMATARDVETLLRMADPRRLDQEIYPKAQQTFGDRASLRRYLGIG